MEALGVVWEVAKSLFSCTNAHAAYVYKLQENLESLNGKWEDLQNKEKDLQIEINRDESTGVMQRTHEVISWLHKFQILGEKMKDIPNSQKVQSNQCLNGYCPKNCVSSYKLGKTIVMRLDEANGLLARARAGNMQIALKQPPKLIDEMPYSETIGLDLMADKVWNSLEDDTVGVIGLYGMGGVGKTTLMKRIHNELGKREHSFDLVLWVVVSRDCDVNKIMNDISNKLGIDEVFWKKSTQDQRVAKIYERLKGKKFLLMLDDLWGKFELETIGVPDLKRSNKSKVMFTTRSVDLCDKMQAQKKHKVECLLQEEAFDLFCKKVGDETLKSHTEIPKLAREMAKECRGLPLALITVGSAMAGVKSFEAWMVAKNDLRSSHWTASDLEDKVFRILKFSYDKLPDKTLKSCFLYCTLYPEDFEIDIDDLIDRWIGEGFLYKDDISIYDMYNHGKSVIEKLILSCLLEEGIGINFSRRKNNMTIKMHDVIRDMALWLARDEDKNKDKVLVQGEVSSLSKMNSKRLNDVERISTTTAQSFIGEFNLPACPNLITICFRCEQFPDTCNKFLSTSFQFLKRLRVLDLSYTRYIVLLPPEIGELINLEFLSISGTSVSQLPIELKKLKILRVFLMDDMRTIEVIPLEVIKSLEQLKVFRFSRHWLFGRTIQGEIPMLEKLESLPNLEELCIQLTSFTSVQRLFQSPKLRGCSRRIRLSWYKQHTIEMSSLLASMSEMTHLDCIYLSEIHSLVDSSSIIDICHLGKLRKVHIQDCGLITHLTWLRHAPLLEYLSIYDCPSIEHMMMEARDDEEVGSKYKNHNMFTNLKYLCLLNLPKLVSIHERVVIFPSLKLIEVYQCPNLRKLPFNSNFAYKNNLVAIKGSTKWWNNLEWDDTTIEHLIGHKFKGQY